MSDREIDDILKQSADAIPDVVPALLDRISRSLGSSLHSVGALPPPWILAGGLVLISGTMALTGAMFLGLHGFRRMTSVEFGLIFSLLGILIWLAATLCVAESVPGSRRLVTPWLLGVSACVALAAVFGLLFHDYGTEGFVAQGVKCLAAGLVLALPTSLGTWLLLRRGFAVNSAAAGFAKGILAGLAGVTMLELHCANFEAPHLIVWHIAVIPISGAIGMMVAWTIRVRGRRPGLPN